MTTASGFGLDVETIGIVPGHDARPREHDTLRLRVAREACGADADDDAVDARLALSPLLARPVSVALATVAHEVVLLDSQLMDLAQPCDLGSSTAQARLYSGERALLEAVAEAFAKAAKTCGFPVTYNGARFDLPLLWARMIACGVPPPAALSDALRQKPWERDYHVDVMAAVSHGPRPLGTLREAAAAILGVDPKAECGGAGVRDLVARRDGEKVARYNLTDARVTLALYHAIRAYL